MLSVGSAKKRNNLIFTSVIINITTIIGHIPTGESGVQADYYYDGVDTT